MEELRGKVAFVTGAEAVAIALDVTDREDWARAAGRAAGMMGPVRLLVNNAGQSTPPSCGRAGGGRPARCVDFPARTSPRGRPPG